MKAFLLAMLLWQVADGAQAPMANQSYFRYQRAITPSAGAHADTTLPACATLDGSIYAHAAPSLKDVRLYEGTREVPYAITLSESAEADSEPAKVLNPGMQGSHIVFALEMPARPYTDVSLDLDAHDFIAAATVSGIEDADPPALVKLGTYTLFDLTAQHLSRSTTLHLQESNFRRLRIELDVTSAPGATAPFHAGPEMILGATVPPSREAQTVYTTVAETAVITQRARQTVAHFHLPARIPVERVSFAIAPGYTGNFSRNVAITGHAQGSPDAALESLTGSIQRVRMGEGMRAIRQEQLSVPATLGANLQQDADVEVRVDNGDDPPLPISAVRLEMRERKVCSHMPTAPLTLFYGDPTLETPVYDFARLFSLAGGVVPAKLTTERPNPLYSPRPVPPRPLTERYPELLWIALLGVVCILGVMALRSAKRMPR